MFAIGGKKDQAKAAALRAAPKSASKTAGGVLRPSNHPKLSMYTETPSADISLEMFEAYALDRMRVLKAIDDGLSRGKKPDEMDVLMNEECAKHLKLNDFATSSIGDDDERRPPLSKDEISHFALRLAYCRTEELRRWFLLNECQLFKHRFSKLDAFAKASFLEEHEMEYKPIQVEEFFTLKRGLSEVLHGFMRREDAERILATGALGFYGVPFEEVADLVKSRRVYVSGGRAFMPRDQLTSLVVGAFRAGLSKSLAVASRRWAQHVAGEERDRLAPVIASLSKRYLGRDFGGGGATGGAEGSASAVTLKDLVPASKQSFPLCAKNLFDAVKREHHLRHEGRRQLQLYMTGIGLSLEEAMLFWKTEFCKKIPAEKFEKEYAYAVRHAYGKEGKRVDYTPHTCLKCISSNPGAGEHHGCPYKTFGEESLTAALGALAIQPLKVRDIVQKAKAHHYQLACGMTFEAIHGKTMDEGVQHPNQYFEESRKALGFVAGAADENAAKGNGSSSPVTPGGAGARPARLSIQAPVSV
jgi:DNA primase large subunit